VKRRSITSDLDVLLWTMVTLLPRLSKRKIPDHLLYWGPISRFITRYFSWFLVDVLVTLFVVAGLGIVWRFFAPLNVGLNTAVLFAFIMVFLFSSFNAALGLSRMMWSKAKAGYALMLFNSVALATGLILLLNQLLPAPLPIPMVIVTGILAWMGFVLVRYRLRLVTGAARHWLSARPRSALLGERVLIVGAGVVGRLAALMLNEEDFLPAYAIVGMVDDDPRKNGMQIGDYCVLGTTEMIPEIVDKYGVDIIIFAITKLEKSSRQRIMESCQKTGARVVFLPDIFKTLKAMFLTTSDNTPNRPIAIEQLKDILMQLDLLIEDGEIEKAQEKIRTLHGVLKASSY
jgi:FlaA1/EpsC-like NDP-sugar epimerase